MAYQDVEEDLEIELCTVRPLSRGFGSPMPIVSNFIPELSADTPN